MALWKVISLKGERKMARFRGVGGETVDVGTYWNFETGEKVKIEQRGLLPGKPSQSYYKAPPLLILAIVAGAAHLLMYVLPKYITQVYAAYAENLVRTYVIADFVVIIAVITGLFIAGVRDIFGGTFRLPSFDWIPGRSFMAIPLKVKEEDRSSKQSEVNKDT